MNDTSVIILYKYVKLSSCLHATAKYLSSSQTKHSLLKILLVNSTSLLLHITTGSDLKRAFLLLTERALCFDDISLLSAFGAHIERSHKDLFPLNSSVNVGDTRN